MHSVLLRSAFLSAVVTAALLTPAVAQSSSGRKARCEQLTSFFDRYGASRSENSDGARNHTRIAAGLECQEGRYAQGITEMEALLKRKHFDVPSAPTGLAQGPSSPSSAVPGTAPRQ
ncbi:hypothetical protein BH11PSE3_BH11PSE3_09250 [soil metagenome]